MTADVDRATPMNRTAEIVCWSLAVLAALAGLVLAPLLGNGGSAVRNPLIIAVLIGVGAYLMRRKRLGRA